MLLASRPGIERGADPPPEETADCVATPSKAPAVAADLAAALDDLEADRELTAALGEDFVRMHCAVERADRERYRAHTSDRERYRAHTSDRERYRAHTSDWERREYLPLF